MLFLRQSTAGQSVLIGPFVDSTDGVTAETGLTIANTDIRLSANGGNMFAKTSGGGTHDEIGWYTITLDATDTATVGRLQLAVAASGALPVFAEFQVLEEAVYDALIGASAPGYLQPTTAGRTLDVTAGGAAGIDWGNVENPTTAVDLSGTDIQLCDTVTTLTGHTAQTGDSFARLGAPAGASVSADVAAVKAETALIVADTNELQTDWANGGRLDLILDSRMAEASINTTAGAIDNVTLVATTTTNTDMRGTDNALLASSAPTNFGDLSITATTGRVDVAAWLGNAVTHGTGGPDVNINAVSDDTAAAATLEAGLEANVTGTTITGTLTTTTMTTDLTEATDDHYNGRVILFRTGALAGQGSVISDYTGATKLITVSPALTEAPGNTDAFIIV